MAFWSGSMPALGSRFEPEAPAPAASGPGAREAEPLFWLAVLVCLWFPFQDLLLAFLYGRGMPGIAIRGMLVAKEMVVALIVGVALLRSMLDTKMRVLTTDVMALLYAAMLTMYLPVGDADLTPRIAQYRSLILPVLLYFCGRAFPATPAALHRWLRVTIGMAMLVTLAGLFERFVLDAEFWRSTVRIGTFLADIKGQEMHLVGDLPGNMYGDYGFGFFQFRRLSSVFGSPLTAGYYLIFPIVLMLCLYLTSRGREAGSAPEAERGLKGFTGHRMLLWTLLCSLALLLTVTRAGVAAVLLAVALALLLYRQVHMVLIALLFGCGFAIVFQDYLGRMLAATLSGDDSSARGHYDFLLSSLDVVLRYPLGLGMGSAGGWAHTLSEQFSGAAENVVLVIVAQASLYAGLLFFLFNFAAIYALHRAERQTGSPLRLGFYRAVLLSNLVYLTTGMLSEQILTFTSVAHFWMSLGFAVTLGEAEASEASDAAA